METVAFVLLPLNFLVFCEDFCLSSLNADFPAVSLIGVHWCSFVVSSESIQITTNEHQ